MKKVIRIAGITVALWAYFAVASTSEEGSRPANYKAWVKHYAKVLGVKDRLHFVVKHHRDFCGWVQLAVNPPGFEPAPYDVLVGISDPDPDCMGVPTKHLALHEVCHLRWQHLYPPFSNLSTAEKHWEVEGCIKHQLKQEAGK